MYKNLSTRGRAILVSIVVGLLVFAISSPIASNLYELLFPPSEVTNVKITEKDSEIDVDWSKNPEGDVISYNLSLGNDEVKIDKDTTTYSFYKLDNSQSYPFSITAEDDSGKVSTPFSINVQPTDKTNTETYNQSNLESDNSRNIIITSLVIAFIVFILNLWVLFFKVNKSTIFTVGLFPSFCTMAFLIFALTLSASISSFSSRLIFSLAVFFGFTLGMYLILLTSNILNGSVHNDIPLSQAGKASQFIFALISTYLILIYAFGSYQDFTTRIIISLPFVYYFSYSSIWMTKNVSSEQVFIRSFVITMIMGLSLLVFSIWPIESVYAILAASVIFYILLNVALEIRKHLNRTIWIEYGILTILILILLFTNGSWGINGTLI